MHETKRTKPHERRRRREPLPAERTREDEAHALNLCQHPAPAHGRASTPRGDDPCDPNDNPVPHRQPDCAPEDDVRVSVDGVQGPRGEHGRIHVETQEFMLEWVQGSEPGVKCRQLIS